MKIRDLIEELRQYPPDAETAVAYWTEDFLMENDGLSREEAVAAIERFMVLENPAGDAMADCVDAARQQEGESCG
jgi:hypothetical protein